MTRNVTANAATIYAFASERGAYTANAKPVLKRHARRQERHALNAAARKEAIEAFTASQQARIAAMMETFYANREAGLLLASHPAIPNSEAADIVFENDYGRRVVRDTQITVLRVNRVASSIKAGVRHVAKQATLRLRRDQAVAWAFCAFRR